ncbi:RHS repeat domain-containing protein [Capnocytophaga canimorsus]|uniref:RHS repeat domain-containing protein n=1 Tax=Capnocytophaga canimorsus TaxID=28188 RepID=UPI00385B624B
MRIKCPDGSVISFKYDAFGRRIEKKTARATTHFVWDGNIPLHEWKTFDYRETTDNDRITWVFQDFVPVAKLQGDKSYSIISDHIGTPLVAIDNEGVKVWERELDIYGKVRKETKETPNFVPFRYQGQYYDSEVDLCYNRFRYYDCNTGSYISQDPIRLAGNNPTLYGYAYDTNMEVDRFGWYNPYPRIKGKFGPNPNPNPQPIKGKIHGNSLQSKELNHLYAKFDEEGNFLKWGKTDDLRSRYSSKELNGGDISPLTMGNIVDIKILERELAEKRPGIDNKEPWAGAKKGEPLSVQAQEVYDKMLDRMNKRKTCKQ